MEVLQQVAAVFNTPAGIVVAFIVLLVVARALGWVELKGPAGLTASRRAVGAGIDPELRVRAARVALEQYGEVAVALEVLINADAASIEAAAREWFTTLATRLGNLLREQGDHLYRVAIWLDDPTDATHFIAVGHGMFHKNDRNMDRLERQYTIGGLAFTSRTRDYYCRDTRTDPMYKPRDTVPPSYRSVYAIALGSPTDPWGVMTVDAKQANGFPDDARWLIQLFGELATLGAISWYEKVTPPASAGGTTTSP